MTAFETMNRVHYFDIYQGDEKIPVDVFAGHAVVADTIVILPVHSRDMLIGLSSPLGRPLLASHLHEQYDSLRKPVKVNDVFSDLQERFEDTLLNGHLIKLQPKTSGRSTWYGIIDEVSDDALLAFAEEGKRIVRSSTRKGRNMDRRLAPFEGLTESIQELDFPDDSEDRHKIGKAIATAGFLTLGTIATVALMRRVKT